MDPQRAAPLRIPDRWHGEIQLDRIGRWAFSVEARPDAGATWRRDLREYARPDRVAIPLAGLREVLGATAATA